MTSPVPEHALRSFHEQGYCVLPGFKNPAAVSELRAAAADIIDDFDPVQNAPTFVSNAAFDQYLLDSANKISCFLEAEALDDEGYLKVPKSRAINKIGHALHDLHPVFDSFSRDPKLAEVAAALGLLEPLIWQSMYILKPPGIGGEIHWHQDATFFFTEPVTVTTFWFALDDADADNGCLWVDANGADTPLREIYEKHAGQVRMRKLDSTPWPELDGAIPLPARAGDLVCFKGTLPHYSAPNRSGRARHAFTLHITDASSRYAETNWIQRDDVRGFEPPVR
ncbi:MAG: phytanoyl-CoA dioxygenase family protein [Pseudomonadota bacterium]